MLMATQRFTAAGAGKWIPLDYHAVGFGVGFAVTLSTNTQTCSYTVEHTYDNIEQTQKATASRSGPTVTLTFTNNHGLVVGDNVVVAGADRPATAEGTITYAAVAGVDGSWRVAVVTSETVITYTCDTVGTVTPAVPVDVAIARVFPHASIAAQSTRKEGNYTIAPFAVRLNMATLGAGYVDFTVLPMGMPR